MNVSEMVAYIQYLETYSEQLVQDQSQYFRQQLEILKAVTAKLNETLSIFAYATVYNEGELKFPKSYFELHQDMNYGIVFDQDSDPDFVIIKLHEQTTEEEEDDETESVPTDGEGDDTNPVD
jgi:hypothetical protein